MPVLMPLSGVTPGTGMVFPGSRYNSDTSLVHLLLSGEPIELVVPAYDPYINAHTASTPQHPVSADTPTPAAHSAPATATGHSLDEHDVWEYLSFVPLIICLVVVPLVPRDRL